MRRQCRERQSPEGKVAHARGVVVTVTVIVGVCEKTEKMVNVLKGVLVECDPAMKQFLLYLDESNALGKKFIIQDLDETHVFVLAELVNFLQERVGELMDQNSFPITQK
ncbi:general transcription factor IIH subunit 5 [Amazona aestiva]|uniref:General transcription and DNA repair factor IIH subunit TFB5 n=1 Tax=Amazona aestiva TaxID=12930 RepID=A0A0Q3URV8_AMAAE|nr:general transcription factor IIH subunit 5 [Amazona aestiva]